MVDVVERREVVETWSARSRTPPRASRGNAPRSADCAAAARRPRRPGAAKEKGVRRAGRPPGPAGRRRLLLHQGDEAGARVEQRGSIAGRKSRAQLTRSSSSTSARPGERRQPARPAWAPTAPGPPTGRSAATGRSRSGRCGSRGWPPRRARGRAAPAAAVSGWRGAGGEKRIDAQAAGDRQRQAADQQETRPGDRPQRADRVGQVRPAGSAGRRAAGLAMPKPRKGQSRRRQPAKRRDRRKGEGQQAGVAAFGLGPVEGAGELADERQAVGPRTHRRQQVFAEARQEPGQRQLEESACRPAARGRWSPACAPTPAGGARRAGGCGAARQKPSSAAIAAWPKPWRRLGAAAAQRKAGDGGEKAAGRRGFGLAGEQQHRGEQSRDRHHPPLAVPPAWPKQADSRRRQPGHPGRHRGMRKERPGHQTAAQGEAAGCQQARPPRQAGHPAEQPGSLEGHQDLERQRRQQVVLDRQRPGHHGDRRSGCACGLSQGELPPSRPSDHSGRWPARRAWRTSSSHGSRQWMASFKRSWRWVAGTAGAPGISPAADPPAPSAGFCRAKGRAAGEAGPTREPRRGLRGAGPGLSPKASRFLASLPARPAALPPTRDRSSSRRTIYAEIA